MPPVIAIVGPTAAGKSDLAVALAQRLGGEVINADSMQLYRGMDIGTAKLTMAERQGIPHHLLDIWEPRHTADVATYQQMARAADRPAARRRSGADTRRRQRPVRAGGARRDGVPRHRSAAARRTRGRARPLRTRRSCTPGSQPPILHAAAAILPGNGRRHRAGAGGRRAHRPLLRPASRTPLAVYDVAFIGLDRPDLDERVAARTERMWQAGFVGGGPAPGSGRPASGRTASRALGTRRCSAWLTGALPARRPPRRRRCGRHADSYAGSGPGSVAIRGYQWLPFPGLECCTVRARELRFGKAQVDAAERLIAGLRLR